MSRSLRLAAGLLAAVMLPAAGDELTNGDDALRRFDLDAAVNAYRAAQQRAPDNYEAAWKLARALLDNATLTQARPAQKKLITEAEILARAAVRLNPKDSHGHTFLAVAVGKRALFEGGKRKVELSKEVKTEAEAALALNPQDDIACHVLGLWHREMAELNWVLKKFAEMFYGKFPPTTLAAAEQNLRRAVTLAPNNVAHRTELGLTLLVAGNRDAARAELAKALELPKTWVTDDHYKTIAKQNYRRTTGT